MTRVCALGTDSSVCHGEPVNQLMRASFGRGSKFEPHIRGFVVFGRVMKTRISTPIA